MDNWKECYDEDGNVYYYNEMTTESTWILPDNSNLSSNITQLTLIDNCEHEDDIKCESSVEKDCDSGTDSDEDVIDENIVVNKVVEIPSNNPPPARSTVETERNLLRANLLEEFLKRKRLENYYQSQIDALKIESQKHRMTVEFLSKNSTPKCTTKSIECQTDPSPKPVLSDSSTQFEFKEPETTLVESQESQTSPCIGEDKCFQVDIVQRAHREQRENAKNQYEMLAQRYRELQKVAQDSRRTQTALVAALEQANARIESLLLGQNEEIHSSEGTLPETILNTTAVVKPIEETKREIEPEDIPEPVVDEDEDEVRGRAQAQVAESDRNVVFECRIGSEICQKNQSAVISVTDDSIELVNEQGQARTWGVDFVMGPAQRNAELFRHLQLTTRQNDNFTIILQGSDYDKQSLIGDENDPGIVARFVSENLKADSGTSFTELEVLCITSKTESVVHEQTYHGSWSLKSIQQSIQSNYFEDCMKFRESMVSTVKKSNTAKKIHLAPTKSQSLIGPMVPPAGSVYITTIHSSNGPLIQLIHAPCLKRLSNQKSNGKSVKMHKKSWKIAESLKNATHAWRTHDALPTKPRRLLSNMQFLRSEKATVHILSHISSRLQNADESYNTLNSAKEYC